MSVLGTHLDHCTSWHCCERLSWASVNFFWRLCQWACSFHDGWFMSAPAHTALSVPPSLVIWSHQSDFYCFSRWKSPQRETFCQCERGETKNSRSTKRHQNRWVQKLFWAVGKHLDRCIASNGDYFEGGFKHTKINTQFFINEIQALFVFVLVPSIMSFFVPGDFLCSETDFIRY